MSLHIPAAAVLVAALALAPAAQAHPRVMPMSAGERAIAAFAHRIGVSVHANDSWITRCSRVKHGVSCWAFWDIAAQGAICAGPALAYYPNSSSFIAVSAHPNQAECVSDNGI